MTRLSIQGTPFFPGRASGRIVRDPGRADGKALLVVTHRGLGVLEAVTAAGLVVVGAAPFSHAMIRVLRLGVPTVLVTHAQAGQLVDGDRASMDGASGHIGELEGVAPPLPEPPVAGTPVRTADAEMVALRASVVDSQGAGYAVAHGAAAIGLVRSEFLVPEAGREPDARYYESALTKICQAGRPLRVTIRLLDLAADKRPAWLRSDSAEGFSGPLGLHGGRLYATDAIGRVVHAELAAIERLVRRFPLAVLVPALDRAEDFQRWRRRIQVGPSNALSVGAMVETPAAALDLGRWLEAADFVAIGCNDLMQCLFGADRDIAAVGAVPDPYAPALHRFLGQVAHAAGEDLSRVQLCGLLPQLPGVLTLLLGNGYRSFSVDPLLVPYLAQVVRQTDTGHAQRLSLRVQAASDSREVRGLLGLPASSVWTPAPESSVS